MFWVLVSVLGVLSFSIFPLPVFIAILVALFISTASVVVAANILIGEVSFVNAFKANTMATYLFVVIFGFTFFGETLDPFKMMATLVIAFVAMLFIYSRYLEAKMTHAFIIVILADVINYASLWLLDATTSLGLEVTAA